MSCPDPYFNAAKLPAGFAIHQRYGPVHEKRGAGSPLLEKSTGA